jgi:hypothetical protein
LPEKGIRPGSSAEGNLFFDFAGFGGNVELMGAEEATTS